MLPRVTDPAASSEQRLARLHAAIATWPLLAWGAFHVWEQSALFRGRLAWLVRMRATSSGVAVGAEPVPGVLPLVPWPPLVVGLRTMSPVNSFVSPLPAGLTNSG